MSMFNAKEPTASPVELAKAEVARLFAIEADLTEQWRQNGAAAEDLDRSTGVAVMDGASVREAAASMLQTQAEARVIERAIGVARKQRVAAIRRLHETEARALRSQAATLRSEAAAIREKCEPWLNRLRQCEGVAEDALVIWAPPFENPAIAIGKVVARVLDQPEPEFPSAPPRPNLAGPLLTPRSVALDEEAERLEQQARDADARDVNSGYWLVKPTIEKILASEEFRDSERLVPAAYAIEKWAAAIEDRLKRERPELLAGERRRTYKITWRDGKIDPGYSSLTFLNTGVIANDATFTAEASE